MRLARLVAVARAAGDWSRAKDSSFGKCEKRFLADGLLVTTLALHLDHRLAPGEDPALANAVAEIDLRWGFDRLCGVIIE